MKINIRPKPLPLGNLRFRFTEDEETFFALLEADENFGKAIYTARSNLNIPHDGFPEVELKGLVDYMQVVRKKFIYKSSAYDKLETCASNICKEYLLPYYLIEDVMYFITFGIMPIAPPNLFPPIEYYGKSLSRRDIIAKLPTVLIEVSQKITKQRLIDYIKKQWDNGLGKEIATLPKHPGSKIKLLEFYQRIDELRKQKIPDKKIEDILNQEFPSKSCGYNEIPGYHKRYKDTVRKLKH